ncbi:dscc1 [Scenedesmus sp. PABB004]|nr:dscc1 [Scenedesmus sp. PABB004]
MGIPKASRKGKKAWRKNIDATEIEEFIVDEGHKQRREPAVESLKDEELFVLDTAADDGAVPAAVRRRGRREPKPLRAQLILDSLREGVKPMPAQPPRKPKGSGLPLSRAAPPAEARPAKKPRRRAPGTRLAAADVWADEPAAGTGRALDWTATAPGVELLRLGKRKAAGEPDAAAPRGGGRAGRRRAAAPVPISAVEVDLPGCSFNPDYESHQDALAVAVAAEYRKQLRAELAPTAPPLHAPAGHAPPADELEALLGEAAPEDEDDEEEGGGEQQRLALAARDEHAIPLDEDSDGDAAALGGSGGPSFAAGAAPRGGAGGAALQRKSRKDRNREARRKSAEADAAARRALKAQRQQLEALGGLQEQLDAEEAAREAARTRRKVVAAEKAAAAPPRLGKQRFEAAPTSVLTSDEVTGSLREITPCFLVSADRFKALQKRGLIEPRKPAGRRRGKVVSYVTGERREKAEARQAEVAALAAARRAAAKGAPGGAAALAAAAAGSGKKRKANKLAERPGPDLALDIEGCGRARRRAGDPRRRPDGGLSLAAARAPHRMEAAQPGHASAQPPPAARGAMRDELSELSAQLQHWRAWQQAAALAAGASGAPLPLPSLQLATQLWVERIPDGTQQHDLVAFLVDLMRAHGAAVAPGAPVTDSSPLGHDRGAALLQMRSAVEASNCLAFDSVTFQGVPLKIRRPQHYDPDVAVLLGPCTPDPAVLTSLQRAGRGGTPALLAPGGELAAGEPPCGAACGGGAAAAGARGGAHLAPPPPPPAAAAPRPPGGRDLVPAAADQSKPDEVFIGGLPSHWKPSHVKELLAPYGQLKSLSVAMDAATGKNKGYAFVVFASPAIVPRAIAELDRRPVDGKTLAVQRATDGKGAGPRARDAAGGGGGAEPPGGAFPLRHHHHHRTSSGSSVGDGLGWLRPRGRRRRRRRRRRAARGGGPRARGPFGGGGKPYDVNELYIGDLPLSWDEEAVRRLLTRFGKIKYFTLRNGRDKNFAFCKFKNGPASVDAAIAGLHGTIVDGFFLNVRRAVEGKAAAAAAVAAAHAGGGGGGGGQGAPAHAPHAAAPWPGRPGGASRGALDAGRAQARAADQQQPPPGARLTGAMAAGGGACSRAAPAPAGEPGHAGADWQQLQPDAAAGAPTARRDGAWQAKEQRESNSTASTAPSPPETPTAPLQLQQPGGAGAPRAAAAAARRRRCCSRASRTSCSWRRRRGPQVRHALAVHARAMAEQEEELDVAALRGNQARPLLLPPASPKPESLRGPHSQPLTPPLPVRRRVAQAKIRELMRRDPKFIARLIAARLEADIAHKQALRAAAAAQLEGDLATFKGMEREAAALVSRARHAHSKLQGRTAAAALQEARGFSASVTTTELIRGGACGARRQGPGAPCSPRALSSAQRVPDATLRVMAPPGSAEEAPAGGGAGAAAAAPAAPAPAPPPRLRLSEIEVEGFKSFRDRTVAGPLGDFTAIVGPNGCGKSALSDAVAFALGGGRRSLRVGSLPALLNTARRAAGHRTAHVALRFDLLPGGDDRAGAVSGAGAQPALEWLGVRRTLRGDAAHSAVKLPGADAWAPVSQAELQAVLARHGLQTAALDRFIVAQSRQAVDVGDPVRLVRRLEMLTGAGDLEARIEEQSRDVEGLAAQINATQEQIAGLECERERLAPLVARWQRVQKQEAELLTARLELARDQQAHGAARLQRQQDVVSAAAAAAATAGSELEAVAGEAAALAQREAELAQRLAGGKRREHALQGKSQKLSAAAVAARFQLSSLAGALEGQRKLQASLEARLAKLRAEEAQHKQAVADRHAELRELQERAQEAAGRAAARRAEQAGHAEGAPNGAAAAALREQLAALDCELAEARGRQALAAARASRGAASVASLRSSAGGAQAAAAAASKQLDDALRALAAATAAAEAAAADVGGVEGEWRAAHTELRELHEQLARARAGAGAKTRGGQPPPGQRSYDAAVAHLKALSDGGALPGTFHGRLHNALAVCDAGAAAAVNAALQETVDLSRTLLVTDRATAAAVIQHFSAHRVGVAQCRVLSELAAPAPAPPPPPGARALLGCVRGAPGVPVPGLDALLGQLLGGWLLVEDRAAARRLLHLRRHLVTRAGEVFKADGEIVAHFPARGGGGGPAAQPCAVPVGSPAPIDAPRDGAGSAAAAREAEAERAAALHALPELERRASDAARAAAAADEALAGAREHVLQQQQARAAAERAVQRLRGQAAAASARVDGVQDDRQQLAAAERKLASAEEAASAAAAAVQQLEARQQALQQEPQPSGGRGRGKRARAAASGGLEAARDAAAAAAAQVEAAWAAADAAKQQQKHACARAAALVKELARVRGARGQQQEQERAALQAKLAATEEQLAAATAELEQLAGERAQLTAQLKPARQAAVAAAKARGAAQRASDACTAELRRQRAELQELRATQQRHVSAVERLQRQLAATGEADAGSEAAHGEQAMEVDSGGPGSPPAGPGPQQGAAAGGGGSPDASQSQSADSDSDSGGDSEGEGRRPGKRARRGGGGRRARDAAGGRAGPAALAAAGAALEARAAALEARGAEVAAARAGVDEAAVERDLAALQALAAALAALERARAAREAAVAAREALLDRRYAQLLGGLNGALEGTYRRLSGGGAATLAYTPERSLLFVQGVSLHAQPDGGAWRRFAALSGGQQALAALALSFALQALCPSPFYVYDEVDCALDGAAAGRVAAFVADACAGGGDGAPAAQYLLVSHRPAVFEAAPCLVGVYANGRGSSAAVLSRAKPRALAYAPGGLRTDLRLLEVDDELLGAIGGEEGVVIKGEPGGDAVLCTAAKTYALKLVETTNCLLLLPPQPELDADFHAVPSLPPDAAGQRDVGLQTQLQKNAAAADHPPLTAVATAASHIELVEVAPRLDLLPRLLGERPYSLEDEDDGGDAAAAEASGAGAGGEAMDADGPGAAAPRALGCHTTEQLLERVQASRAELLAELRRLGAVQLGGVWRLVDEAYLGGLLEMLTMTALERGWPLDALPLEEAVAAMQPDGYIPAITQHCLEVFGDRSAAPQAGGASYALDERRACLHYARKLLSQRDAWPESEFMAAWRAAVPGCWAPREEMLLGEALLLQPEPSEGFPEPRLRSLPARSLPAAPGARFAALFAAQPRWTREQLDPYLAGMQVPGQTVEMLLLKHARASQRSPTDPTPLFVAR